MAYFVLAVLATGAILAAISAFDFARKAVEYTPENLADADRAVDYCGLVVVDPRDFERGGR